MRMMYDSTNPFDIPANAQMVAGYINGTYKWSDAGWARFPNAVKVRIATRANVMDGHVLDIETGAAWPPAVAVDWVLARRAAGVDPTVYVNQLNDWQPTRQAFAARNVAEPHWWVARYNNDVTIPAGAVAKQYANSTILGIHADKSSVVDYWPGVDRSNDMSVPTDVWGHTLDFDPNSFEPGDPVPAGGPAWMHMTNANLYATRASQKAQDTYNRVVQLTSQYEVVTAQLGRIEAMLELLVGDGVRVTADGVITIGIQPK